MNIQITVVSSLDFINQVNKIRLENKNKWYFIECSTPHGKILLKCFKTWVQIAKYKSIKSGSGMDMKVSEFKEYLDNLYINNSEV